MTEPTIIHEIPLCVTLRSDDVVIICDDPLANVKSCDYVIRRPPQPGIKQRVRFTVVDVLDSPGYDDHLQVYSAISLERLAAWKSANGVFTSVEYDLGRDIEIVVIAFAEPRANPDAEVKIRYGRRRVKIRSQGGGGDFLGDGD